MLLDDHGHQMCHEVLYSSTGVLRYSRGTVGYRLVVNIDPEITRYYRSLVPKWIKLNAQMYPPHISVVRHEVPVCLEAWGKYEGERVTYQYSPVIHHGEVYWWLNVFATRLEEIRVDLGLPVSSMYTRPPDGYAKVFHTTLGNTKSI